MKYIWLVFLISGYPFLSFNVGEISCKDGFKNFYTIKTDGGNIPISKFRSLKTGLTFVIVDIEGPTVQGFFAVPTEASSNDGLPHSLEHLIFHGSENYPNRGTFNILANRCFASMTNAWTDTDQTVYIIETAGSEGFLKFLPIYLDHVLYPTLNNSSFTTEIHHINGKGQDGGVVYSEMQGKENSAPQRTINRITQLLYPIPSGYHYETGGVMANLRNSSIEKIRRYHKSFYRPENLYVIIAGRVNPIDVQKTIDSFEKKITEKKDRSKFLKPWGRKPPPFNESKEEFLYYPSDEENIGTVAIGFRGPSITKNLREFQSIEILLDFLTESSVSILQKAFVEAKDPLATHIQYSIFRYRESSFLLKFNGVLVKNIELVKPLLAKTLGNLAFGEIPLDKAAMRDLLRRRILEDENKLENKPHRPLAELIIADSIYGDKAGRFLKAIINKKRWYKTLITKPASYWKNLINKYFLDSPFALVKGIPSKAESKRLQEQKRLMVKKRTQTLGKDGLKKLGQLLANAQSANKQPVPDSVQQSIPLASSNKINFFRYKSYTSIMNHNSGMINKTTPSLFNMDDVPVKMLLSDVKSNFIQLISILDTASLSANDRLYLPLLKELMLSSSMFLKSGNIPTPFEEVIKQLKQDTIATGILNGISAKRGPMSPYNENFRINLKLERRKYEKGVSWMKAILYKVNFNDSERISAKANQLLNKFTDEKSNGQEVVYLMANDLFFQQETNINKENILRQEQFLKQVVETLKTKPEKITKEISDVYKRIKKKDKVTIVMAVNLKKLKTNRNRMKPWKNFIPRSQDNKAFSVVSDADKQASWNPTPITGYIAGMETESSFLMQFTKSISNYSDSDLPALMMALLYFSQSQSPLWINVRGKGLAYGAGLIIEPNSGRLYFRISKASNLFEAYEASMKIINSYLDGKEPYNRLYFESTKGKLIGQMVAQERVIPDVVKQSILALYRKVKLDYNKSFIKSIEAITMEGMKKAFKKYIRPLFNPKSSKTVITCPSTIADKLKEGFSKLGHNLKVVQSLKESRFAKY